MKQKWQRPYAVIYVIVMGAPGALLYLLLFNFR